MSDANTLRENVREAEIALDAAKKAYEVAQKAERDAHLAELRARQAKEFEKVMALPDSAFYLMPNDKRDYYRPYVLPFGNDYARFNPLSDEDRVNHEFGDLWTANSTAIICKKDERSKPTRLIWTSGTMISETDKIGQRFEARHDQTNAKLGEYEIVGLAIFGPDAKLARVIGDVPNQKFAQSTYK